MEKEEMELIQRLQNTQTVQRNAYEELENALGQTSQQISVSMCLNMMVPFQRFLSESYLFGGLGRLIHTHIDL